MELKNQQTNNQATFRDEGGQKNCLTPPRGQTQDWSRRGHIERPDNFFPI